MRHAPEVDDFETQDHIRLTDGRARSAIGLVERMARREVHSRVRVEHAALQNVGELDQPIDRYLRTSE